MNLFEAIRSRRSIRAFSDKPLERQLLERIVDAGRFAATARNVQPWEFVVVSERGMLKSLAALADNGRFIADAAACIAVFCSDTKYYLEDGCAATQNMLLAAGGLGIGSCWVAGDKKSYCNQVSALLAAPASLKLVSLIALGYPQDANIPNPQKRNLSEVIHLERF